MYLSLELNNLILKLDNNIFNFDSNNVFDLLSENLNKDNNIYKINNINFLSDKVDIYIEKSQSLDIYILFQTSDFFDSNITNAKVFKRFVKKFNLNKSYINLLHNTKAQIKGDAIAWKEILFSYDPKQGDINLKISC